MEAALSTRKSLTLRVLPISQNRTVVLSALDTILYYSRDSDKVSAILRGQGCLPCACKLAMEILQDVWPDMDPSRVKMVIID